MHWSLPGHKCVEFAHSSMSMHQRCSIECSSSLNVRSCVVKIILWLLSSRSWNDHAPDDPHNYTQTHLFKTIRTITGIRSWNLDPKKTRKFYDRILNYFCMIVWRNIFFATENSMIAFEIFALCVCTDERVWLEFIFVDIIDFITNWWRYSSTFVCQMMIHIMVHSKC